MREAVYITIAAALGFGSAFQVSLLTAMGRARGSPEAAWVSILASITGAATLLTVRSIRGDDPILPAPFDRTAAVAILGAITGLALALSMRGLAPYFAITGLFGIAFLATAPIISPTLGLGLFVSATLAGQLTGAVLLDHIGVLGAEPHPIDPVRVAGIAALFLGVILIRSR